MNIITRPQIKVAELAATSEHGITSKDVAVLLNTTTQNANRILSRAAKNNLLTGDYSSTQYRYKAKAGWEKAEVAEVDFKERMKHVSAARLSYDRRGSERVYSDRLHLDRPSDTSHLNEFWGWNKPRCGVPA